MGGFCPPVLTNGPVRSGPEWTALRNGSRQERTERSNERSGLGQKGTERVLKQRLSTGSKPVDYKGTVIEWLERLANDYMVKQTVTGRFKPFDDRCWDRLITGHSTKRMVIERSSNRPMTALFVDERSSNGH